MLDVRVIVIDVENVDGKVRRRLLLCERARWVVNARVLWVRAKSNKIRFISVLKEAKTKE